MTARRFFACIGVALGVLCAFNVLLAFKIDSVANFILREMRAQPRIDMLFLGNSLMKSGLDTDAFEAAWPPPGPPPRAFNAGFGSSYPVEHYLLAHQAYLHHEPIPCLVYGFFDLQLTDPERHAWKDLVANQAMVYSTEPSVAASLFEPGSTLEKWRFHIIGAAPMLRDHSQLWKYVEILRRRLQEIGMAKATVNQFGRVADFEAVSQPRQPEFDEACERVVERSAPFMSAVQALLELARAEHSRVVVVEMPMTSTHRDACYATAAWRRYRAYLRQRLRSAGASYVLASDWIPDAGFSDGLHLTEDGAKRFSTRLAPAIAAETAAR